MRLLFFIDTEGSGWIQTLGEISQRDERPVSTSLHGLTVCFREGPSRRDSGH